MKCNDCGQQLQRRAEKALAGEERSAMVWATVDEEWVCPLTGNEHDPVDDDASDTRFDRMREWVMALVNEAANDVDYFADLPDEGARDALNLVVNVFGARLRERNASVEDVITNSYQAAGVDPDDLVDTVRSWVSA